MGKIKTIYTFGSSYTAGGGFEFDSPYLHEDFPSLYSQFDEVQTPFNFSWPGQLQKLLGDSVKVINLAKQGAGNDRTERLLYDIINSKNFNKDETLFLIEITATGRDELFSKDLNDYLVLNYNFIEDGFSFTSVSKDYAYQTQKDIEYLENYSDFFKIFIDKFKSVNDEMDKLERRVNFLLTYLENNSINFLLSSSPEFFRKYNKNKLIEYGDGKYFSKNKCFIEFTYLNKMTIKDETNGLSQDLHSGFNSNKLVSNIIFNKLVEDKFINFDKKEIDWKYYKNLKPIKKIL